MNILVGILGGITGAAVALFLIERYRNGILLSWILAAIATVAAVAIYYLGAP